MNGLEKPGAAAVKERGWISAHKWLLARRLVQAGVLGLFLLGPLAGVWIVKGNLAASLTLDVLPLTDPYVFLQTLLAGQAVKTTALLGAVIVLAFYVLVGGRTYCSWVCPINPITDLAHWLRARLGLKGGVQFTRRARYWLLAMTLAVAWITGSVAWELVNPVSMVFRGLVFGLGFAWTVILAVFLFDLFVSNRGWCGHLCPVGAFYGLLGTASLVRISAKRRSACDDCMDCFAVCPEPQVINPALKGADKGVSPVIRFSACTNCGRCIDVCAKDVFGFTTRFNSKEIDSDTPGEAPALRDAA